MFSALKTDAMSSTPTRSEEVVNAYKRRKLTISAMRRIQELIQSFEQERATDRRLAVIGLVAILLLVGFSLYSMLGSSSVTLG